MKSRHELSMQSDLCGTHRAKSTQSQTRSSRYRRLHAHGMENSMATAKVTVTLEVRQLNAIRSLVEARSAKSVSAFVQHAADGVLLARPAKPAKKRRKAA